jgi:type IV secretory pathway TraG/TraD family ATPase VirD4
MGLMAGYGLQLWPILQDMSQLRDLYGARASTFIANAGVQQVFGVNDFEMAKWLNQTMGQETIGFHTALLHGSLTSRNAPYPRRISCSTREAGGSQVRPYG